METKDMTQEQISALLDSELGDAHVEAVLASLRRSEGRATWDVYHQIGDVLRSEDMAQDFSNGFTATLLARLDEEPPILAPPKQVEAQPAQLQQGGAGYRFSRFAFPVAVAAAAVFAVVMVPQMTKKPQDQLDPIQKVSLPAQSGGGNVVLTSATPADGAMLRDPRLEQYLLAHQRYSPSWNSSAEYARSATYTVTSDSNK